MKWTEITLYGKELLSFEGRQVAMVERQQDGSRINALVIHFNTGIHVELRAAVDVSEQLPYPRIFVIESDLRDKFMLVGGEVAYWLTPDGSVQAELSLYRKWGEEEYWTTSMLEDEKGIIVIYEAGVLAIDDALQVRWHSPKLLNDNFSGMEHDTLKFDRDGDTTWFMRLDDGSVSR
jgi:hypothetical protein